MYSVFYAGGIFAAVALFFLLKKVIRSCAADRKDDIIGYIQTMRGMVN